MNFNAELNSINDFVSYVKTCKEAMRQALISQEQVVSEEATLDTYAGYISAIEGGGGGIPVYTVTYLNWDGTVLKSEYALTGQTVTPPQTPTKEGWTFTGWDGASENVQSNMTITAQFTDDPNVVVFLNPFGGIEKTQIVGGGDDATPPTVDWGILVLDYWSDYTNIQLSRVVVPTFHIQDDRTEITTVLTSATGKSPNIYLWPSGGNAEIEWGDGGSPQTATTNSLYAHTYPDYGTYVMRPYRTTAANLTLGFTTGGWPDGYKPLYYEEAYAAAVVKAICGTDAKCTGATFIGNNKLVDVCLKGFTGNTDDKTFYQCTSLEHILFEEIAVIGYRLFYGCSKLKRVIILSPSVATLSDTAAFSGCHTDLAIYVPDALVADYKTATKWLSISTKIKPLSDLTNG